jgi:AcrR family transcriptional regulator
MHEPNSDLILRQDQSVDNENNHTGKRRRGEVLEDDILQAAWDELSKVGYGKLTMEGVAIRARTNKSVVYRRWANKGKLVFAAIHKQVLSNTEGVPDTGNLSNDVFVLLRRIAQPLQLIGADTLHALMLEHLSEDLIPLTPQVILIGTGGTLTISMMTILKNAELRGEVNLEKITPLIISLPLDLLRYKILTTHEPISDKTLTEIVDDIFIPLIHA